MFLKLTPLGYDRTQLVDGFVLINMARILEVRKGDGSNDGGSDMWMERTLDEEPDFRVTESPEQIMGMMKGGV